LAGSGDLTGKPLINGSPEAKRGNGRRSSSR
jgi:hypothetical protein